jgi:hypothetical protein
MLRSIVAVIVGSVTWMVTALGTDALVMSLFPQWYNNGGRVEGVPVLLFAMSYSLLFSILGGYVTALIAGRSEVKHAFILGVLQLLMGMMATIKFWDTAPAWYHISFLTLLIPANLLGGLIRLRQKGNSARQQLRTA